MKQQPAITRREIDTRIQTFEKYFSQPPFSQIADMAIHKSLKTTGIRGICWKVFLGLLDGPTSLWRQQLKEQRIHYQKLVDEYQLNPQPGSMDLDPLFNNPLSTEANSPWGQFFQQNELKKIIGQDLDRTYPEQPFFRRTDIREMMLRILFVFSSKNAYLSYKQGMHELLAPIVYVLETEQLDRKKTYSDPPSDDPLSVQTEKSRPTSTTNEPKEDWEELFFSLNDIQYLEADSFLVFERLMCITGPWFGTDSATDENVSLSPLLRKCRHIQNTLLREKDPALHDHLCTLQIEPQIYCLRWLRLLFGREFHLEDLLCLWDALFGYGNDLQLVDYVAVAMLIFIRSNILGADYSSAMRRLFKYPPVEDVHLFVEKALKLKKPPKPKAAPKSPFHAAPKAAQSSSSSSSSSSSHPTHDDSKGLLSGLGAIKHIIEPGNMNPATRRIKYLEKEVLHLRQLQQVQSERLENIISLLTKNVQVLHTQREEERLDQLDGTSEEVKLQKAILRQQKEAEKEKTFDMDEVHVAIAELKQVKDILNGTLPFDPPPLNNPVSEPTSPPNSLSSSASFSFSGGTLPTLNSTSPNSMSSTSSPALAPQGVEQNLDDSSRKDPLLGLTF